MNALHLSNLILDDPTVRILDVRTASEFDNGHIDGAYNVPLDLLGEHAREIRATQARVIALVCQSGQRARRAENLLRAAGMPNLHVLEGGMNAWKARGLPVKRIRPRMSIERQVRVAAGALAGAGGIAALAVDPWFALLPAFVGSGLVFAGVTDTCAMGMLLARLPYNRGAASCDTESIVQRFLANQGPS